MNKPLSMLLIGASLAGCTPFAQVTETQPIFDEMITADWSNTGQVQTPAPISWQSFDDPILQDLIKRGIEQNLGLQSQRLSLEQLRINLQTTRLRLFPQLSVDGPSVSYSNPREGDSSKSVGMSSSLSYEVDLWSDVNKAVEQQLISIDDFLDTLLTARISVATSITQSYFGLRAQDEELRLQREQLGILQKQKRLTEVNFSVGAVTRQAIDQLEVQIARLQSSIESLEIERENAELALANTLGLGKQQFRLQPKAFEYLEIPRLLPDAPAAVLVNRPDIRGAERSIKNADISVELARNAWLPNINVATSGSTSVVDSFGSLGDLISDDLLPLNLSANLSQLLFDNGNRERTILSSEISHEQALISYRETLLSALREMENALNTQRSNLAQIEIQRREEEAQNRVTAVTMIRYQTGAADAFDLITEQANSLATQSTKVNNWLQGMSASIGLLQAMAIDPI